MGGNGDKSAGILETEEWRRWKTIEVLKTGAKVIEFKDPKKPGKMPEESHSPRSIYLMMNKNGEGVKSIAVYDKDCKKVVEIHTADHKGLGVHYHDWDNGHPVSVHPISDSITWKNLLNYIIEDL
jgi:hypothetical protein